MAYFVRVLVFLLLPVFSISSNVAHKGSNDECICENRLRQHTSQINTLQIELRKTRHTLVSLINNVSIMHFCIRRIEQNSGVIE